jgi:hypothetical protein
MPAITPSRIRAGTEFNDLRHSTFAGRKRVYWYVFVVGLKFVLASGKCVLEIEAIRS